MFCFGKKSFSFFWILITLNFMVLMNESEGETHEYQYFFLSTHLVKTEYLWSWFNISTNIY